MHARARTSAVLASVATEGLRLLLELVADAERKDAEGHTAAARMLLRRMADVNLERALNIFEENV
jgi:hypothetical protein